MYQITDGAMLGQRTLSILIICLSSSTILFCLQSHDVHIMNEMLTPENRLENTQSSIIDSLDSHVYPYKVCE